MTSDDNQIFDALAGLPPVATDREWECRVRDRCHAALSKRVAQKRTQRDFRRAVLASISSAAFLFVYLAATFAEAMRLAKHP